MVLEASETLLQKNLQIVKETAEAELNGVELNLKAIMAVVDNRANCEVFNIVHLGLGIRLSAPQSEVSKQAITSAQRLILNIHQVECTNPEAHSEVLES